MAVFFTIEKNRYVDSLDSLYFTELINRQNDVVSGYASMFSLSFMQSLQVEGLLVPEIEKANESDFIVVADCKNKQAFDNLLSALPACKREKTNSKATNACHSIQDAVKVLPGANLCSIAVPGEYVMEEVTKALNLGLHCIVFSNNVSLEDEREMKIMAREKGLLCMGPDCGVANIDGAALALASINNRGPFGICGASGTGIQHVAAILHECDTGVSQAIGTGGNDLKKGVGGIMMQMGIDALEADEQTKYLILISRKPDPDVLNVILERISKCQKPVVVFFMGTTREEIEEANAIFAENLDDCAQKALALVGKKFELETSLDIEIQAQKLSEGIQGSQKYLRGLFTGGTYMDEAMRFMEPDIGHIWSNAPLQPEWKLNDSTVCVENSCIDFGEEEFTRGRPHPAIDPSVRKPSIMIEASDPQVAVLILDFILTPPGHPDPVGYVMQDITKALLYAEGQGRKLVVLATVLGTNADLQNKEIQENKLRAAGAIVCKTNIIASHLAASIIKIQKGK